MLRAGEFRLTDAIFRCCVTAALTPVGGVPGADLNPDASSVFRFGAQYRDELTPASVTNAPGEPGLRPGTVGQELSRVVRVGFGFHSAQHVGDLEILDHQKVVAGHQLAGLLVVKVLAPVGDLAVPRGHRLPASGPAIGATLSALQSPLGHLQPGGLLTCPPRIGDLGAIRECRVGRHPDIDTDLMTGGRQRVSRHVVTGQHQHPAAAPTLDLNRFHPTLDPAMLMHIDLADALQVHPLVVGQPAGPITVFGPLHAVKPRRALEPRIPRCLSGLHAAEEPVERLVESA